MQSLIDMVQFMELLVEGYEPMRVGNNECMIGLRGFLGCWVQVPFNFKAFKDFLNKHTPYLTN